MRTYFQLPSLSQWHKDSWINGAYRRDDPILVRVDNIVDAINKTASEGESHYLYGELYFATNHWLKSLQFSVNPKMEKGRETAIRELCRLTIQKLAAAFKVPTQSLPNALEKFYGKGMSEHGRHQDNAVIGTQHYMDRAQTNRFRVFFKQGLAYQFLYRSFNPDMQLLNSAHWSQFTADSKKKVKLTETDPISHSQHSLLVSVLDVDWAYYVMSMSRDIYMGPHMNGIGQVALVHSSWLAGTPVQASGSMLIEEGVVKGIRNNSGHYQPSDEHMLNVLELFRTVGVDLKQVSVHDYAGRDFHLNGEEFLNERANWDNILKRSTWKPDQPIRTTPFQKAPVTAGPGSKPKRKYRCPLCSKTYESSAPPVYCQYCRMSCVAV